MAVVNINYEDGNTSTYKGVEFHFSVNDEVKVFNSGDFVKDWYDCNKFIVFELDRIDEYHIVCSSSLDHFLQDGDDYDPVYLIEQEDKTWELFSLDYVNENNIYDGYIEYFVPKGVMMTWEEMKAKYDDI